MHMYLLFPLLAPLLQYYAPHWMALSSISNSTQKSGNYIQILLFIYSLTFILSVLVLKFILLSPILGAAIWEIRLTALFT